MLLDRCPVLSVLSETLVYCGQTVGWIKIKLGMQVSLCPCHTVLDGDPATPPQRGTAPNFRPIPIVAKWLDGSSATWRIRLNRPCAAAMRPYVKLERGPMPNVMVVLPNISGALCSTPQSLADAHYLTAVQ